MFCPHCGTALPDDAKFCGECGAILEELIPAAEPASEEADFAPEQQMQFPATEPVEELQVPQAEPVEAPVEQPLVMEELTLEGIPAPQVSQAFFDPAAADGEELFGDDVWTDPLMDAPNGKKAKKAKKVKEPKAPTEKKVKEPKPVKEKKVKQKPQAFDEMGMPVPKKKGKGKMIALIIVLVVLLAAGGLFAWWWFANAPKEAGVVEADFVEQMGLAEGQWQNFLVDEATRNTDRWNGRDKVFVSVTTIQDNVQCQGQYEIDYTKTGEGWTLHTVKPYNEELWIFNPLAGPVDDVVMDNLIGMKVPVYEDYIYTLQQMDLATAQVVSHDTDLSRGTDKAIVLVAAAEDLYSWTVEVEVDFTFNKAWEMVGFNMGDVELEVDEDKKFDLTDEEIVEAMCAEEIVVLVGEKAEAEEEAEVEIETEAEAEADTEAETEEETEEVIDGEAITMEVTVDGIKDFKVNESLFSPGDSTQRILCSFTIDRGVTTLTVEGELIFAYEKDGWEYTEAVLTAEAGEFSLAGEWIGTYTTTDGLKPSLKVVIKQAEDGTLSGTVTMGLSDEAANFAPGDCNYYVTVSYDAEKQELVCTPNSAWLGYLPYSGMAPQTLTGTVEPISGVYADGTNFSVTAQPAQEPAEEAAPAA